MSAKWELVFTNASDFTKESIESKRKRFKTADKMNRNLEKMKLEDLIKEGLDTHRDNTYKKASYDAAKAEGKLWSKEQMRASKEAKKAERQVKRLAKKTA